MSSQPAEPTTVGGYTLLTRIGEGGMGVVHLARDAEGHRVALKLLRPHIVGDDEARRRLAREVSSLERVRSRWVAEIIDADPWAEVPFVATRYVPGLSLHDHAHSEGPIEGVDLLWFAGCLAEGLAAVHAAGVMHRDVKPSNVLMEGRTPILIDFGLARVADDPKLTHTGWLLGTPGYLAPEILYGDDATPASDVHSWAATVAFAGTGRAPFGRGPSMAIMDRVRRGEHDLSRLPAGPLHDVVAACLDPEPERRPSLDAVLAWLRPQTTRPQPLLAAPPPISPPISPPAPTAPYNRSTVGPDADPTVVQPTVPAGGPPVDAFTLPIEIAMSTHLPPSAAPTRHDAPAPTRVQAAQSGQVPPAAPVLQPLPLQAPPEGHVPYAPGPGSWPDARPDPWPDPWPQAWGAPAEPVPLAQRLRRGTLVVSGMLAVAALLTAVPWVVLAVVVLATWVLRSGSLAAEDVGARRRVRGRKWYDGVLLLVHAPWRVVQALPGTLLLLAWSLGLTAAAALICYAAAATTTLSLAVCSSVFALALWWGPGGARVRSPLSRVLHPTARTTGWWLIGVGVLFAVAVGAGLFVLSHGVAWTPADRRPFDAALR